MSDLVGNPEDRFSQNEAHIISAVNNKGADPTEQMLMVICALDVRICRIQVTLGAADQRLCFHYIKTTIPLLPKTEISSL